MSCSGQDARAKVFGQLSIVQDIGFCLGIGHTRSISVFVVATFLAILISSGLGELDEEDSCPPDLEAVDVQQQQPQQQQLQFGFQQELGADSELIKNLMIAIKVSTIFLFIQLVFINWFISLVIFRL